TPMFFVPDADESTKVERDLPARWVAASNNCAFSDLFTIVFGEVDPPKESAGRISPPGAGFSLGAELSLMLLHTDGKRDPWAVGQVNAKRIGVARGQVGSGHVKVPLRTIKSERNVRNNGFAAFIYVINRTPHSTCHGQFATLWII